MDVGGTSKAMKQIRLRTGMRKSMKKRWNVLLGWQVASALVVRTRCHASGVRFEAAPRAWQMMTVEWLECFERCAILELPWLWAYGKSMPELQCASGDRSRHGFYNFASYKRAHTNGRCPPDLSPPRDFGEAGAAAKQQPSNFHTSFPQPTNQPANIVNNPTFVVPNPAI